jgi:flagellar biosynthetic protein FliP
MADHDMRRDINRVLAASALALCITGIAAPAEAQSILETVLGKQNGSTWSGIIQLALVVTTLSVAPAILMMVTCFPRFLIAFSFLRAGIGLPSTPSNLILINMALFMTLFVMAPVFDVAYQTGLKPLSDGKIELNDAVRKMSEPFIAFMKDNVREKDLAVFKTLAHERLKLTESQMEDDIRIVVPAFMISELRRGFEIGFLVVLPFLVIDLVVATVVMAMGMMMLSPQAFSMPLKVLFFVLIDGWTLLVGSLIKSFG